MYSLSVDIVSTDSFMSEEEFRELTGVCLSYLEALKGALDNRPSGITFYPPSPFDKFQVWSLRYVLMISAGKQRGENLMKFYPAIVRLLEYDLPDFEIKAEMAVLNFS